MGAAHPGADRSTTTIHQWHFVESGIFIELNGNQQRSMQAEPARHFCDERSERDFDQKTAKMNACRSIQNQEVRQSVSRRRQQCGSRVGLPRSAADARHCAVGHRVSCSLRICKRSVVVRGADRHGTSLASLQCAAPGSPTALQVTSSFIGRRGPMAFGTAHRDRKVSFALAN